MMVISINLEGDSLCKRCQQLNKIVEDTFKSDVPFENIQIANEHSTVERLFKIDLASKCKNVDYILKSLRDLDMLYVSRALKSTWLFKDAEYGSIINPNHLEKVLYPSMTKTAMTKMKKAVYLNIKDESRSQEFYQYYKEDNINYAIKFLPNCKEDYLLTEMLDIPHKIDAQYLKLLCEKTSKAAEVYFKSILTSKESRSKSLYTFSTRQQFLTKIKIILKVNPDLFFYIIETYYTNRNKLGAKACKFMLENQKDKVLSKIELYASKILKLDVLARFLSTDEIKEVIEKLARAEYLGGFCTYKNMEPLLNKLDKSERKVFVKKIFVDKDFGEMIKESPYPFPKDPEVVIEDQFSEYQYTELSYDAGFACSALFSAPMQIKHKMSMKMVVQKKTLLDELFDKYRFDSFSKTFYELQKLLLTETQPNNRMMIVNVLVSKSGGKEDQVKPLMEFLCQRHCNEPSHVKASVIRSLVRRSRVYLLSEDCWKLVVSFSRGIETEDCSEYVHANIIRLALSETQCPEDVFKSYLKCFNTLSEFKMTVSERNSVQNYVLSLLILHVQTLLKQKKNQKAEVDKQINVGDIVFILFKIFELLTTMKLNIQDRTDVIPLIKSMYEIDKDNSKIVLTYLFEKKVCRKLFFKENFELYQNNKSYVNALKHDATLLKNMDLFEKFVQTGQLNHENFLTKLSIYFENDLAKDYLAVLKKLTDSELSSQFKVRLARSICILNGPATFPTLQDLDSKSDNYKKLAAIILQNIHLVRPKINPDSVTWTDIPAVAACNVLTPLSNEKVESLLPKLRSVKGRQFSRLYLDFSYKSLTPEKLAKNFSKIDKKEYKIALKQGLSYIRSQGEKLDLRVWNEIKNVILDIDLNKIEGGDSEENQVVGFQPKLKSYRRRDNRKKFKKGIVNNLMKITDIPSHIKPDYCIAIYKAFKKIGFSRKNKGSLKFLVVVLQYISQYFFKFDTDFIGELLEDLSVIGVTDTGSHDGYDYTRHNISYDKFYTAILAKSLLACTTVEMQNERYEKFGRSFLKSIQSNWTTVGLHGVIETSYQSKETLVLFLRSLKNTRIFMNSSYVSPIPMFEKVIAVMKEFLQIEQSFTFYSDIHLTMIYYKTVRECLKQWPDILDDRIFIKNEKTIEKFGVVFGRYLAYEFDELIGKFFLSITSMYKGDLSSYISSYFVHGRLQQLFKESIIKGLVEDKSKQNALRLAVLLYRDWVYDAEKVKEMKKMFEAFHNSEIDFFMKVKLGHTFGIMHRVY